MVVGILYLAYLLLVVLLRESVCIYLLVKVIDRLRRIFNWRLGYTIRVSLRNRLRLIILTFLLIFVVIFLLLVVLILFVWFIISVIIDFKLFFFLLFHIVFSILVHRFIKELRRRLNVITGFFRCMISSLVRVSSCTIVGTHRSKNIINIQIWVTLRKHTFELWDKLIFIVLIVALNQLLLLRLFFFLR